MLLRFKVVVVVSCWLAVSGFAQDAPAKPAGLDPVAWFVGGTWVSEVKDPQSGAVIHVENNMTWAPNHEAIEFLTKFNGQPHYNGFYAYNAASKTVTFYYTSAEGELTIGTAVPDAAGKTIRQEFDITHASGRVSQVRSSIERDGDNAYWFTVFLQKNGQWSPEFKIHYQRK
jgi:hypothetical protein